MSNPPAASLNAPSPLLACHNLTRIYRMGESKLTVLDGVNLAVNPGQWLAILGRSGSGKSTLLHLLGGLDQPDAGEITFRNQPIRFVRNAPLDRYRNRDVGFVFQFYHLLPELNALENVLLTSMVSSGPLQWLGRRHEARKRATQLLNQMGLGDRLKHRPAKLSGGERQRVAIARAMLNQPAVLLADEPTGNLDADTGTRILDIFKEIHAAGQTIIMVTHDDRIADAADDRLRLTRGKIETPTATTRHQPHFPTRPRSTSTFDTRQMAVM